MLIYISMIILIESFILGIADDPKTDISQLNDYLLAA